MNEPNPIRLAVSEADLDPSRSLTLRDVRRLFPFNGRKRSRINLDTLRRWANSRRGFRPSPNSDRKVILPAVLAGGELLTMPAWVEWFLARAAEIREGRPCPA